MLRTWVDRCVSNRWFKDAITAVIALNAIALVLSTEGHNTFWFEKGVLILFTIEAGLKIYARGWSGYAASGWNRFDFAVVAVGWALPVLALFFSTPQWLAALVRTIRLLRILERFESTRRLLATLGASIPGQRGALLLSGVIVFVCVLAGTKMFAHLPPFVSITQTWLSLTLHLGDTVVFAQGLEKPGTLYAFMYFFQFSVVLVMVNLFITVMFDGMQRSQPNEVRPATRGQLAHVHEETLARLDMIEQHLKRLDTRVRASSSRRDADS